MPDLTSPAAFEFDLPNELIAQQPLAERSASRLLVVAEQGVEDRHITDLPSLLKPDDLLVFNDTRVIKARLFGQKSTGGRVEVLIERLTGEFTALAQLRVSKSPKADAVIVLDGGESITVQGREAAFFALEFSSPVLDVLDAQGHVPLPPYIERADAEDDERRYQTLFADRPGAVAAPTAGLHFDQPLLDAIKTLGVATAKVTLHVGAGTFQPLRVDDVNAHQMHAEWINLRAETVAAIAACRARGGRVVAVGTTVVRTLESAARASNGELAAYAGETRLFIHPAAGPDQFQVVDALVTNFHLPQSTLLMLVCAFAGYERVMAAYQHAVANNYRFFSYGDAMFLSRSKVG